MKKLLYIINLSQIIRATYETNDKDICISIRNQIHDLQVILDGNRSTKCIAALPFVYNVNFYIHYIQMISSKLLLQEAQSSSDRFADIIKYIVVPINKAFVFHTFVKEKHADKDMYDDASKFAKIAAKEYTLTYRNELRKSMQKGYNEKITRIKELYKEKFDSSKVKKIAMKLRILVETLSPEVHKFCALHGVYANNFDDALNELINNYSFIPAIDSKIYDLEHIDLKHPNDVLRKLSIIVICIYRINSILLLDIAKK